ncbi:polysaccharide deacetylase family protein [Streptomyces sp. NPDC126499]|uniref:polysaccharide deacetylase family protein n=1 Tax=Streptomyces sp. NPDC126499 TaxID=3155314 RepID=UPI0033267D4D
MVELTGTPGPAEALRRALGPRGRRAARYAVDAVAGPWLGSVRRVRTDLPYVAVTFDDGPDRTWTPQLLDVLAERASHATFFMLLYNARRNPGLVRRVVAEGHEVALHGADHRSLVHLSRRAVRDRLTAAAAELAAIAGAPVTLFRPPFGAQTLRTYLGVRAAGLDCVVWDLDSLDWCGEDERQVADRVLADAAAGTIVLAHDGRAAADEPPDSGAPDGSRAVRPPRMAELLLGGLERRGLRTTTVSDLLTTGKPHRTVWLSHYVPPEHPRWRRDGTTDEER